MGKPIPDNDLAPTLRELLAASPLKQGRVAELAGIDESRLSALAAGRVKRQEDAVLVALATALGVSPDVLRRAQRRPRRLEPDADLTPELRAAFHNAKGLIPEEEKEEYYRDVLADVQHLTRKYVERARGPSHYRSARP